MQQGCGVYYDSSHRTGLLCSALVLLVIRGRVAQTGARCMSRDRQWESER
jgi:hypothetical protein